MRWIAAEPDFIAYLRESKTESILVVLAARGCKVNINLAQYGYRISKTLYGRKSKGDRLSFTSNGAAQGIYKLA